MLDTVTTNGGDGDKTRPVDSVVDVDVLRPVKELLDCAEFKLVERTMLEPVDTMEPELVDLTMLKLANCVVGEITEVVTSKGRGLVASSPCRYTLTELIAQ